MLANGGSITTGNIDADLVDMTSTSGNITTGDVFAFGAVAMDAFGDILAGDILAGSIDLLAGDDITTGDLSTQLFLLTQEGGGGKQFLFPGASITLEAGGDISTGDIASIDGVYADAGGALNTGDIDAFDFVQLFAVNNIGTGEIDAGDFIQITSANGGVTTGDLTSGTDIDLDAAGDIAFGAVNAEDLDFDAGGNVTGGNIAVATVATGNADGTVTLGNITAGPALPVDDDFSVGIAAGATSLSATSPGPAQSALQPTANLTTGNLTAGDLVMTMVGGNISTGSIIDRRTRWARFTWPMTSMFVAGGGGDHRRRRLRSVHRPRARSGRRPAARSPSTARSTPACSAPRPGTSLTTQAINAGDIEASAGGTATIDGIWNAGDSVTLRSNDIDIAGNGGIDAGRADHPDFDQRHPGADRRRPDRHRLRVDRTPSSAGLPAANVAIVGRGDASAAIDMLVGDLTVTGPLAGSTIEERERRLGLRGRQYPRRKSRAASSASPATSSRPALADGNSIEFYADRFELDAANGSWHRLAGQRTA